MNALLSRVADSSDPLRSNGYGFMHGFCLYVPLPHCSCAHRGEVTGYMMKASEFFNRLDPTTLQIVRDHSEQILNHRIERINSISSAAQKRKDIRVLYPKKKS